MAAFLPEFLEPRDGEQKFFKLTLKAFEPVELRFSFAWNPRLLRLNPHAARRRDALVSALTSRMTRQSQNAGRPRLGIGG